MVLGVWLPVCKGGSAFIAGPRLMDSVAASSESKEIARVKKGLSKMGDKRPEKLKSFLRHLESMLGNSTTQAAVQAVVKKLELANILQISGEKVRYT